MVDWIPCHGYGFACQQWELETITGTGLSPFHKWNSLTMAFAGTFGYIHLYLYLSICLSIYLSKLSTWYFEHSGDISCSLLVNPSHTDDSWEGQNTRLWIYMLSIYSLSTLENTDENRTFFIRSAHHKHFGKAQYLVLWALWWHQLFSTR